MPWRPILSLLHININSLHIQGNPLLSITGNGGSYISQSNSQDWQLYPIPGQPRRDTSYQASLAPASRRVEAQLRVRRKLDEVRNYPGSIYDIDSVAQLATDILSIVEEPSSSTLSYSLMDLAMDAYAMAYIALISCIYRLEESGRRRTKKKTVQKLRRLLNSVHDLLVEEVAQKGLYARIKIIFSNKRRSERIQCMREELLDILRDIEKDENANILASLTTALDCPYQ